MTGYDVPQTVKYTSLEELIEIFRWLRNRGEEESHPTTVLIGGWAVYTYNPWYGSVDIDLVTNNKTRQDLMWYLRKERGFVPKRDKMNITTVMRNIAGGTIVIDFGSREDIYKFEGRDEQCPSSPLDGHTEVRAINPGFSVVVPERTLLITFKLKAAWDRSFRIQNGLSSDEEWEKGKLRKDRADILALLDPAAGGRTIDIQYLGERLHSYPFLTESLRKIPDDIDAINMYRMMNQVDVRDSIEGLLQLAL
jgi:hypothetical protein